MQRRLDMHRGAHNARRRRHRDFGGWFAVSTNTALSLVVAGGKQLTEPNPTQACQAAAARASSQPAKANVDKKVGVICLFSAPCLPSLSANLSCARLHAPERC